MDKIEKSFMFSGLDESEKKIVVDAMEEKKTFKNEVVMCLPSTAYVKKTFSNREEYLKKYQDIEKGFSAHPSLLKGK
jgi:hypothetical protein